MAGVQNSGIDPAVVARREEAVEPVRLLLVLDQPHAPPVTVPSRRTPGRLDRSSRPSAPITAARAAATPEALWHAAREVRLADTRTLTRLVRWRIPGVVRRPDLHRAVPHTTPSRCSTRATCGRCPGCAGGSGPSARDYPRLSGRRTSAPWDRRGTVRVLFAHWAEPAATAADARSARRASSRSTRPRGCGCGRCGR